MTIQELKTEVLERNKDFTFDQWDKSIIKCGFAHKKDRQLIEAENLYPEKITRLQKYLDELLLKPVLTDSQRAENQVKISELDKQMRKKINTLKATKDERFKKKLVEEHHELMSDQSLLQKELNRPEYIEYFNLKIERLKNKFLMVIKEIEFRKDKLVKRKIIGTTYYLDFNCQSGVLTGIWTFTNGSGTVSASVGTGLALSELSVGDYVRVSNGSQWYKITSITDDDTFAITPTFQQANVTDGNGVTKFNDKAGTSTANAFCHANQYTEDTGRSGGDILKVRANQTHLYKGVHIDIDDDGQADNYITIKGCSIADDPFGDVSDVKPIFGFGDSNYHITLVTDDYWRLERIEVIESTHTDGNLYIRGCDYSKFISCVFRDALNHGVLSDGDYWMVLFEDCEFYSNNTSNYGSDSSDGDITRFKNCVFNGGVATTNYGIACAGNYHNGYLVQIIDCDFGQTISHDSVDVAASRGTSIETRNCKFDKPLTSIGDQYTNRFMRSGDYQGVKGDQFSVYPYGTITKEKTIVRVGGGLSSGKMQPDSCVNSQKWLSLSGLWPMTGDFKIWCAASLTTVTIYIRSLGAWGTYPTAAQLYIAAEYLDQVSGGRRAEVVSNDVLADETTWIAFDVTFTPLQAGWVYITVNLRKYESGKGCYVDIKPVVT